jgi:C4-dicarboxylate transporter, DctM subunit
MAWIIILAVVLLLALGEPLFVILGSLAVLCFAVLSQLDGDVSLSLHLMREIMEKIGDLADKDVLLAIPFFVIAGAIMTKGEISGKLIGVARALVGWLPGGLGVATVLACAFFAAISGSSPATVIAIGSIMVPALIADRYNENFSLGLVTTSGSLGILIPPSIPMIVYCLVKTSGEKIDVGELFLAGVGPGLLISTMLIAYSMYSGAKFKVASQSFSLREVGRACRDGVWALSLPFVILGGIYSGIFTPTEAAAVSVIYALVIEAFIHRNLTVGALIEVMEESARLMGALLIIMIMAMGFNAFLVDEKIPEAMALWLKSKALGPFAFLLLVNLLLIVAGGVMDILSAIMILVPLLAPVGESLGIEPIHLAIVFIVNLELGYMTPPIGLNLFVTASVFNKPLGQVIKSVLPTLGIMVVAVVIVTFVPTVQMGLVNVFRGESFYEPFPTGAPEAAPTVGIGVPEVGEKPEIAPKKKIKSLQDLTNEADDDDDDDDDEVDSKSPPPVKKPKIRSLEDLTNDAEDEIEASNAPKVPAAKAAPKPKGIRSLSDLTDSADKELAKEDE